MLQRSSTHIVKSDSLMDLGLGDLYSERAVAAGMTTDKADLTFASLPYRIMAAFQRTVYDAIRERDKDFYDRLAAAGIKTAELEHRRSRNLVPSHEHYADTGSASAGVTILQVDAVHVPGFRRLTLHRLDVVQHNRTVLPIRSERAAAATTNVGPGADSGQDRNRQADDEGAAVT